MTDMVGDLIGFAWSAIVWLVKNIVWVITQVIDTIMILPKEWLAAMVLFLSVTFAGFAIYQTGEHSMTTKMTAWLVMVIVFGIIFIVLAGLAGLDLPALLGV